MGFKDQQPLWNIVGLGVMALMRWIYASQSFCTGTSQSDAVYFYTQDSIAQLTGAVENTDCISAEG